jgi:cytochrome c-type biogenesis protein CcsB
MTLETILFWIGASGYALATLAVTAGWVFRRPKWSDAAYFTTIAAFAAHTGSIVARWVASGRLPYVQDYENALAGTWAIVLVYLLVTMRKPGLRAMGVAVLPFVLITLGYGLTLPMEAGPATPAYKSVWLVIHVVFAWATFSAYVSCGALGIVELLKTGKKAPREGSLLERTPSVERIQELTFRLVGFGFLVNAAMIASGGIWGYELWGSYWRWDPVETWSLLTWLAYAFYLHARLTLGWRGRRLAWIAVGAIFGVFMAFWGVQLFPTSYHLFRDLGGTMFESGRPQ